MKSRFLTEIIKKKSNTKFGKIMVLTGARQTGKTTLAKKMFLNYEYLSIEDPLLRTDLKK